VPADGEHPDLGQDLLRLRIACRTLGIARSLLPRSRVPEWQELAKDRRGWKTMLKSIRIWR
jgi:hypothetical protein